MSPENSDPAFQKLMELHADVSTVLGKIDGMEKAMEVQGRNTQKSFDLIHEVIRDNNARDQRIQSVEDTAKDAKTGLKDHKDKHWQWLVLIVSVTGIVVGSVKAFFK